MRFSLALLPALVACNVITPPPTAQGLARVVQVVDDPTQMEFYGCGDMHTYVYDADDTAALNISVMDGIVWEAASTDTVITRSYTLPHPDVSVTAKWGERVTILDCNDAIDMNNMPQIDGTATALTGTLELTIRPTGATDPWGFYSAADIELFDAELQDDVTGDTETVDSAILEEVSVGWLPG